MYTNTLKLNNGVEIPQLGLGTWFIDDDKVSYFCMIGCVVAAFLLSSLFDAFFLPMERSMRNDV